MNEITNPNLYRERLNAGIYDKLFFLNYIFDANLFFDYGCGDGALGYFLNQHLGRDIHYYGYDNNEEMLNNLYEEIHDNSASFNFNSNRENLLNLLNERKKQNDKSCLILSSIIHEIYHYSETYNDVLKFWNFVFNSNFDYIVIRDMSFIKRFNLKSDENNKCISVSAQVLEKINENFYDEPDTLKRKYHDFKKVFGPLNDYPNIIEFLLKYKYNENWDREVKEKYLHISYQDLKANLSLWRNYELIYDELFTLPYLKRQIENDFGITNFDLKTHVKMILKRK